MLLGQMLSSLVSSTLLFGLLIVSVVSLLYGKEYRAKT